MKAWLRALRAEFLKLKHTLALWMILLSPLTIAALLVLEMIMVAHRGSGTHVPTVTPATAWHGLGKAMFSLWCLLMLPLFVTLQTSLLAALEHGNNQWKHLQALPLPRSAHYLAKLTVLTVMVICAYVILLALTPLAGWILMHAAPSSGLRGPPLLRGIFAPAASSLAACLLILALQTWIALRWQNFTQAVSVGIVATVVGLIVGQSQYGKFFPWTLPVQAFAGDGHNARFAVWTGLIGGFTIAALGLLDFLRRDSQ